MVEFAPHSSHFERPAPSVTSVRSDADPAARHLPPSVPGTGSSPLLTPGAMVYLQRTIGNRALTQLVRERSPDGNAASPGPAIINRGRQAPEQDTLRPGGVTAARTAGAGRPAPGPPIVSRQTPAAPSGTAAASAGTVQERVQKALRLHRKFLGQHEAYWFALSAVSLIVDEFGFPKQHVARYLYTRDQQDMPRGCERAIACASGVDGRSELRFTPQAFTTYPELVATVAHEFEHVRQNYMGGPEDTHAHEFLAYSTEVLGIRLPKLPPEAMVDRAQSVLNHWRQLKPDDRKSYWLRFEAVRRHLQERFDREAPEEAKRQAPSGLAELDPFGAEFLEWAQTKPPPPWDLYKKVLEDFNGETKP